MGSVEAEKVRPTVAKRLSNQFQGHPFSTPSPQTRVIYLQNLTHELSRKTVIYLAFPLTLIFSCLLLDLK